jgi:hypothetical protein
MKLRQALQGCSSGQLARIVASWALPVEAGTLRRELVDQIAEWLEREAQVADFWSRLDARERDVLGALVRAGGRHDAELLVRRLTSSLPLDVDPEMDQRQVHLALTGLLERGILYRLFEAAEQRQGVSFVLPDELVEGARSTLGPSPVTAGPTPVDPPSIVVRCTPADDLFALASALRREAWGAPSRGLAGRPVRSAGQILARLGASGQPGPGQPAQRWRFLLWVAQRAGWIDRAPLPRPHDDAVPRLLRAPQSFPARALEAGPASASGRDGRGSATAVARPQRLQPDVLQLLSELPAGLWWSPVALAAWVTDQLSEDTGDARRPSRLADRQRRTVERWLAGRWYWLGLIEWGRTDGGWTAVRPTSALRSVMTGRAVDVPGNAHSACIAGADLTLLAPSATDLAALYRAEPYLVYGGSDAAGRRYRLTPPSFERGLRRGGSASDLAVLVAQLTNEPLPDSWRTKIEQWSRPEGRLRLSAELILAADDEQTMADALVQAAARDAVIERLSATRARIDGARLVALLTDLASAGQPVEIDPGLRAEPTHAGRAAALSGSAAEAAWIGLEIARRLAPEIVDGQRDLSAARQQLEAIFSEARLEALGRRVASIVSAASDRKKPRARRRVV